MDPEREMAAETLRAAREVLDDLIRTETERGPSSELSETRTELEAEIQTLETALRAWDEWANRRDADPGR
jgi:hypothetical protein